MATPLFSTMVQLTRAYSPLHPRLLVSFSSGFKAILSLISNGSLHSLLRKTASALQMVVLICVMSSFPLLCLLLFGLNAHHKCETYLGFVHYDRRNLQKLLSSVAPLFLSLSMWQDRNIGNFVSLFSVYLHLLWDDISFISVTRIGLRLPRHANDPPLGFPVHVFSSLF